ncbi:MAG: GTPase domain-containing protein, partial [Candidatus Aminicenantes bacterium]|nr:GTPase domain-containing protein [Candidatus Aminicenantes bacterium]
MFINHSSKEVTAKIVYYGTGLSGKTTNLQYIFSVTNPDSRGELVSVETDIERTLFFDLLPINVGLIKGYFTKFQLYTVPGQIFYNSTRKMVFEGADGVVFVADSQEAMADANLESLANLRTNMLEGNSELSSIPLVFQYNKRDLKNTSSTEKRNKFLNPDGLPYFEAVSTKGSGVVETLREISTLTLENIKKEIDMLDTKSGIKPVISFDINTEKKIIPKEDIPLKRIKSDEDDKGHDIVHDINLGELEEEIIVLDDEMEPPEHSIKGNKEKDIGDKGGLGLLNTLRSDSSRLTIINKIKSSERYKIDIKDCDSKIIKTIDLNLSPGVEKINLILEVE